MTVATMIRRTWFPAVMAATVGEGMKESGWSAWEREIQDLLGLDSTICSGNKFNDIGDATDNRPPADGSFRLLVDCKYTEKNSFSISRKTMQQWILRGVEQGKRAIMAVRIWPRGMPHEADYVVLSLDDFAELLAKARASDQDREIYYGRGYQAAVKKEREDKPRCPNQGSICNCTGACLPKPRASGAALGIDPNLVRQITDRTWMERDEAKRF